MEYTIEHIERAIKNLDSLMPAKLNKKSTRKCSKKETVFMMAPLLLMKREMGCTAKELKKGLADEGIDINEQTLNRYLLAYVEIRNGEPVAKPKRTVNKKKQSDEAGQSDADKANEDQSAKNIDVPTEQDEPQAQAYLDEDEEPYELDEAPDESEEEADDD